MKNINRLNGTQELPESLQAHIDYELERFEETPRRFKTANPTEALINDCFDKTDKVKAIIEGIQKMDQENIQAMSRGLIEDLPTEKMSVNSFMGLK